jgi:AmiR/NasT family two-component response regulator
MKAGAFAVVENPYDPGFVQELIDIAMERAEWASRLCL